MEFAGILIISYCLWDRSGSVMILKGARES
jgi:hypothetical protein